MSNKKESVKIDVNFDVTNARIELKKLKKEIAELKTGPKDGVEINLSAIGTKEANEKKIKEIESALDKVKLLNIKAVENEISWTKNEQKRLSEEEIEIKKQTLDGKLLLIEKYNAETDKSSAGNILAEIQFMEITAEKRLELITQQKDELLKLETELTGEKSKIEKAYYAEIVSNYDEAQAAQAEIKAKTDAIEKARKEYRMASLLTAEINTQNEIIRVKKEAGQATEEELKKLDLLEAARRKKRLDDAVSYGEKSVEIAQKTSDFLTEIDGDRIKREKQEADEKYEEDKQKEEQKLKDGTYTQEQYDAAIENLQKVRDEKKKKLDQRQAILQKSKALFEVAVNTAKAISAANPNIPLMAFAAVSGAIQAATIARTTYPKAARGGLIGGKPHSLGGTLIEAEAGEAVINKRSTSMFAPLLSAINESGGGVPFASALSDGGFAQREYQRRNRAGLNEAQMEQAMARAFSQQQIYVAIEDINKGQKQYAEIKDMSKF